MTNRMQVFYISLSARILRFRRINFTFFVDGVRNRLAAPGFIAAFLIIIVRFKVVFRLVPSNGFLVNLRNVLNEFLFVILELIAFFATIFELGNQATFRDIETFLTILHLWNIAAARFLIAAVLITLHITGK